MRERGVNRHKNRAGTAKKKLNSGHLAQLSQAKGRHQIIDGINTRLHKVNRQAAGDPVLINRGFNIPYAGPIHTKNNKFPVADHINGNMVTTAQFNTIMQNLYSGLAPSGWQIGTFVQVLQLYAGPFW